MYSFWAVVILFGAFCVLNFIFNILFEVVKARIASKALTDKINLIYAELVKKVISIKSDLKVGKKNEV